MFCSILSAWRTPINAPINAIPPDLAARLTAPSAAYKNSVRLALACLLLFVVLYCALAGWFVYTAWQVFVDGAGSDLGSLSYFMAACSLFIGALMIKAMFSVRHAGNDGLLEVTEQDQPRLFAYLFELADAARAPRPHKVFLSARVNAAVFYDLSLYKLFFPSRKNLEIGLPLVNALARGELRAVLAHEFGHFAQRSMAVGSWVYVAHQIVSHMVTQRDKLDAFLEGVCRIDARLVFLVGPLQLIIWSIRSLVESVFRLVLMMQRALSREMEMQADLVAVSLTGSDALIHALHRTRRADDAWTRALAFLASEHAQGRATRDVFSLQTEMLRLMSGILNDPTYADVPPLPGQGRDQHRIFKPGLAQRPKMWLTHPLNHEREDNAKRIYVAAPPDPVSAWSVFDHTASLRTAVTTSLRGEGDSVAVDLDQSLRALAQPFEREQFDARYRGIYFGRALTRHAPDLGALRAGHYHAKQELLETLYPAALAADIELLRTLESERAQLEALIAGTLTAAGSVLHVRGEKFGMAQLPAALARVREDSARIAARLHQHDWLCRSWHQNMGHQLGRGWDAYLDGLLALVHYAEHRLAALRDAQGMLENAVAIITALRRVNADGVTRVVGEANELYNVMAQLYREAGSVHLSPRLIEQLGMASGWRAALGQFSMEFAYEGNINAWMREAAPLVTSLAGRLDALRGAALDELLATEAKIARCSRIGEGMRSAPQCSRVPPSYPVLLAGGERQRQRQLGWWARFQLADGRAPAAARLLVAGTIVIAALSAGKFGAGGVSVFASDPVIMVYNGLGLPVRVNIDGRQQNVAAHAHLAFSVPVLGKHHVEARSEDARLIEAFDAVSRPRAHPVYNVASAAPLVEWTVAYGPVDAVPQKVLGTPRWIESKANLLFEEPPMGISGREGGYRSVLSGMDDATPQVQLSALADAAQAMSLALVHARWDSTATADAETWLGMAGQLPQFAAVLEERLRAAPRDVMLRRVEMDRASAARKPALCGELAAQAAARPEDGDLAYLALRCRGDDAGVATRMAEARALAGQAVAGALDRLRQDAGRRLRRRGAGARAAGARHARHGRRCRHEPGAGAAHAGAGFVSRGARRAGGEVAPLEAPAGDRGGPDAATADEHLPVAGDWGPRRRHPRGGSGTGARRARAAACGGLGRRQCRHDQARHDAAVRARPGQRHHLDRAGAGDPAWLRRGALARRDARSLRRGPGAHAGLLRPHRRRQGSARGRPPARRGRPRDAPARLERRAGAAGPEGAGRVAQGGHAHAVCLRAAVFRGDVSTARSQIPGCAKPTIISGSRTPCALY
ncbi:M48 family metallopeptidase [Massilia genomosp. 1]|uniref:M48 family metalloprotease n=1 Tax=Massilia genomosp. 1 TaxID=2609280 RepID=A0ABX0MRI6_9BURK|nr:M48 family metallopeptidase [Massilia genomosp. 1]NHZ61969.1 M48 family metalloprotease [Massilia genomosp. 1]